MSSNQRRIARIANAKKSLSQTKKMSNFSSDEDNDCPLCMEEIEVDDKYFKPCPCGYVVCRFCWNHIKNDLNGLCPACRRAYSDDLIQFKPVPPEEYSDA